MTQPALLIVCPTSHMDWDWTHSFEEYYKTNVKGGAGTHPVQDILDAATSLFMSQSAFYFSVAELGWIQRYLLAQQGMLSGALNLSLLGGAITSPDNIVCDGEVFVRTYLVGRQWAQSAGLSPLVANVCWVPDDFGHDPELPIILSAMGLTAAAFARVPGAFPNYNSPIGGGSSLACTLMSDGVAFNWQASDTSTVFAHFMPDTYGVPFYSDGDTANASAWSSFLESEFLSASYNDICSSLSAVKWPGEIAFAPAGGDFAKPDTAWLGGVNTLNQQQSDTTATLGTFSDYISAVQSSGAALVTQQIDPSNFWTGYFGSRPELKLLQARASRDLGAAETVSSLLRLGAVTGSAALDSLDASIDQVWNILAPSSHHDFVTGTSPDRVYKMEQLPMLSLAAGLARDIYHRAIKIIADSIPSTGSGTVIVVHNAVAVERSGIFKLETGYAVSFGTSNAVVQPLHGGGSLVQTPTVPSLGYVSGMVVPSEPGAPFDPVTVNDSVTIDNGTIAITLSQDQLWAITSIVPSGGSDVLPKNTAANLLQIYQDSGNIYQYGNEPNAGGNFQPNTGALTAGSAVQTENGPLRWRVKASLTGPNNTEYLIEYTLIVGESLVRMKVTGSAPSGSTVVTTFPASTTDGSTKATHLIYGTAHHFHEDAAPAYWTGPTFKATHDFLIPAFGSAGVVCPLAAIYHSGMPSWACNDGTILGSLFRNTDGMSRGAAGTDSDTHTQRYALRISASPLDPAQGTPLIESLQVTTPLRAVLASTANQPESPVTLPVSASLASVPAPAVIRVTRPMGEPRSAAKTPAQGQVAIRLYRPDANGEETPVQLTMPVLTSASSATAQLVTALEQPIDNAPAVSFTNNNVLTVPAKFAVTTIAVTATRPVTMPTNGKDVFEVPPIRSR
jgi:alpha-mannosidase